MGTIEFNEDLSGDPLVYQCGTEAFGLWVLSVGYVIRLGGGIYPNEEVLFTDSRGRLTPLLIGAGFWEWCEAGYRVLNPIMSRSGRPAYRHVVAQGKVPTATRQLVYGRDGLWCRFCGATDDLTLDHIQPRSLGGSHSPTNLRVLCRSCNSSRGARV